MIARASRPFVAPAARTLPDERGACHALRAQVVRLEDELCGLACSAWARGSAATGSSGRRLLAWSSDERRPDPPARGDARLLSLEELERLRDALAHRVADARVEPAARAEAEERARRLVEEMLLDPAGHRWARVLSRDIGDPGCRSFHVRPRAGLLGMLAGWWRVVVSSGCP